MKRLVSSSEAAQLLGLSLQGIHYRIKKGQLESIKKEGKIFVYVDSNISKPQNTQIQKNIQQENQTNDYKKLEEKILKSKDEQIHFLKKTIKSMKKQHEGEINRLDKTQKQMLNVFQSEVDLLKSAFNEMRNIYKLEHQENKVAKVEEVIIPTSKVDMEFMDIKEFFVFMKSYNKTNAQIKNIILDQVKCGDKRFIYKKDTNSILIYKSDFLDIV